MTNRMLSEDPRPSVSSAASPGVAAPALPHLPAAPAAGPFQGEIIAVFDLPWQSKLLSANARVHWAAKAKATKAARTAARDACAAAMTRLFRSPERARLVFWHVPPKGRRCDRDNAISRCKAASDGVADAICVDDGDWLRDDVLWPSWGEGQVRVMIYAIPA